MKTIFATLLASLFLLTSCAIVPTNVQNRKLSPDSSTPPQYDMYNGGVVRFIKNEKGQITHADLTSNKRNEYNLLIKKYETRFLKMKNVHLEHDAGIVKIVDQYGNELYRIDAEHFKYLAVLKQWNRNQISP